jgi:hemoglobin-like flavoprotein
MYGLATAEASHGFMIESYEQTVGRRRLTARSFRDKSFQEIIVLSPEDIMLVRASFAQIAPIQTKAADLFYGRLFEVAPELRRLFPADLHEQKQKLMAMIGTAVGALHDLDALVPKVEALGMRHAAYGALPVHYEVVGEVLLWTLERGLGAAFTPEVRAAWIKVYSGLSAMMQAGAAEMAEIQAAE